MKMQILFCSEIKNFETVTAAWNQVQDPWEQDLCDLVDWNTMEASPSPGLGEEKLAKCKEIHRNRIIIKDLSTKEMWQHL